MRFQQSAINLWEYGLPLFDTLLKSILLLFKLQTVFSTLYRIYDICHGHYSCHGHYIFMFGLKISEVNLCFAIS